MLWISSLSYTYINSNSSNGVNVVRNSSVWIDSNSTNGIANNSGWGILITRGAFGDNLDIPTYSNNTSGTWTATMGGYGMGT